MAVVQIANGTNAGGSAAVMSTAFSAPSFKFSTGVTAGNLLVCIAQSIQSDITPGFPTVGQNGWTLMPSGHVSAGSSAVCLQVWTRTATSGDGRGPLLPYDDASGNYNSGGSGNGFLVFLYEISTTTALDVVNTGSGAPSDGNTLTTSLTSTDSSELAIVSAALYGSGGGVTLNTGGGSPGTWTVEVGPGIMAGGAQAVASSGATVNASVDVHNYGVYDWCWVQFLLTAGGPPSPTNGGNSFWVW